VSTVLLGDRYRLGDPIATGGMGTVYRAVDQVLGRPVAVKVLKRELAEDPTFVERFRREARAAARLSHPNVAGVYDYGELDDQAFIVMELVEGETLAARIARAGPLPWPDAFAIGEQVARALAAAHAHGLVHRDVKPANVLLGQAAGRGGELVKVTDFGIAQAAQSATLTGSGMVLGSANYVAPEQAQGGHVGPAADLYSLGCVLFEMVTDQTPYTGANAVAIAGQHVTAPVPNPRDRRADLPGPVAAVIMKAMRKEPERRFATAAAMGDALAETRNPGGGTAGEPTAVLPPVPPARAPAGAATVALPAAGIPASPRPGPDQSGTDADPHPDRPDVGWSTPGRPYPVRPGPAHGDRTRGRTGIGTGTWVRALVAVAVAGLALLAWVSLRGAQETGAPAGRPGSPTRPATGVAGKVRLPDVRGSDAEQAAAGLRGLGLEVQVSRRHGTVTGTRPRPGSLVPRGSTVSLIVAKDKRDGRGNDEQNNSGQNNNEGD
jgi:serine/threonine protein kinase